ncbi:hypothetical protein Poli38472_011909 [Pythium oligandrum]|uniref:Elongator complex protein 4 n=1 Tax=Pythium oligandrum TaxID=41045 RepID=A0A8K1FDG3_PYTOL|nr:hypothetical protein Poli38472_011909 [Pythium oligandrum]|eukprot:TMW58321.1 hypothetical protein Poli38472_011909 [Pythium oligandrum]
MSSFRRKIPTHAAAGAASAPLKRQLAGTKPFLNGQTLISTGLAQLDAILGGGLLLGTTVWLDVPRGDLGGASAALVDDFHRYFLAEGVVSGQCAVLAADEAEAFVQQQLPMELSLAQKQVKQQLAAMDVSKDSEQSATGELTIAWQYQKYLSDNAGSNSQRFCHSYDLSRPMHPELLSANPPVTLDISQFIDVEGPSSPASVYTRLLNEVKRLVQSRTTEGDGQVVRICIREVGSPLLSVEGASIQAHMSAIFAFLRGLRIASASKPVVCQLSGHLHAFPVGFAKECAHLCDYVMEIKSFMGENDMLPAELSEFNGLLDIHKLARVHALTCHSLDAVKYGIKRERRKMKIEKFHLPPEGSRSSTDKDKAKPAASSNSKPSNLVSSSFTRKKSSNVGCGGGSSSGFDPLDF